MINKESVPKNINLDNYIYGCDICLNACPWNKKPRINNSKILGLNPNMQKLIDSINNNNPDKSIFNKAKKNSAIENIKFQKLLSNIEKSKEDFLAKSLIIRN
jgi:epoxyqueuosine reductase QueG